MVKENFAQEQLNLKGTHTKYPFRFMMSKMKEKSYYRFINI